MARGGWRVGWRQAGLEAAAGLFALAVLAAASWPQQPAPLGPAAAWSQRAAPAVDALALDLSAATAQPQLSTRSARGLARDVARAERIGGPPDRARADLWRKTLTDVRAALSQAPVDPAAARSDLNAAALEMSGLSAAAQAQ